MLMKPTSIPLGPASAQVHRMGLRRLAGGRLELGGSAHARIGSVLNYRLMLVSVRF